MTSISQIKEGGNLRINLADLPFIWRRKMEYLKNVFVVFVCFSLAMITGCASLFNASPSLLNVMTDPQNAKVTITGLQNMERLTKQTPCTVYLNKGSDYTVKIELAGYQSEEIPIRRSISGWFWGNLLIGGIIGMVIDYGTANMWAHEPTGLNIDLSKISSLPDTIAIEYPVILLMADGTKTVKNLPIIFHKIG